MSVASIRENYHARFLNVRAFDVILQSPKFKEAYDNAPEDEKSKLKDIIEQNRTGYLRDWVTKNRPEELENLSYRELRELCKENHIYRWSRLDRDQMVEALRRASILRRG
jgi:hypothetical protein